ncbi:hypothetical protein [Arsenicicoccus dermatophilus]|uniref:hypothetical protein n=1 Tax=Arsenicicoccus dermatophilus TaxID=1076331 RepID=UPI0039170605
MATRLGVPPIDPSRYVVPRPMESLATVTLVIPVAITTAMLPARVPWLTAVPGRDLRAYRAALLVGILAAQLPAVALVAHAGELPITQVAAAWLFLTSLGVLTTTVHARLAGLVPALTILTFSQASELPPFAWNIFYNLDRQPTLLALDALLLPLAAAAYIHRGAHRTS